MVEEAAIVLGERNPGDAPLSYIADGYEPYHAGGLRGTPGSAKAGYQSYNWEIHQSGV